MKPSSGKELSGRDRKTHAAGELQEGCCESKQVSEIFHVCTCRGDGSRGHAKLELSCRPWFTEALSLL